MKVLIAGDYCPQNRVAKLLDEQRFDEVLSEVKEITRQVDLSIMNFECAVVKGHEKPIRKCGSLLGYNTKGVDALKWAGFDVACMANNHVRDFGSDGIMNTISACKERDIDIVGAGANSKEAARILYKEVAGQRLALINCCEHEFSISTNQSAGANHLDAIRQYYDIKEAKSNADYVVVIVHGGHEHYQLPSPRMKETYRFFVDSGADAVVNHHQHCYSGYEVYKGKPIFYGLGNFCFDKGGPRDKKWHEGMMVLLGFNEDGVKYEIIPYNQCEKRPCVEVMKDNKEILSRVSELSEIISDTNKLEEAYSKYCEQSMRAVNLLLEPISNRYVRALQQRHILPMYHFWGKSILRLYNIIFCEAHRDRVLAFLNKEYKKCEY